MSKYKYGTARIALFKEFRIDKSYTLEASLYGSNDQHFSIEDFEDIGKTLINGLFILYYEEELNYKILKFLEEKKTPNYSIEDEITQRIQEFSSILPQIFHIPDEILSNKDNTFKKNPLMKLKYPKKLVQRSICLTNFPKIFDLDSQENLTSATFGIERKEIILGKNNLRLRELSLTGDNRIPAIKGNRNSARNSFRILKIKN